MQPGRFLETVYCRNVCIFCLSRLRDPLVTPRRNAIRTGTRRHFRSSPHSRRPPAEAAALREDDAAAASRTQPFPPSANPSWYGTQGQNPGRPATAIPVHQFGRLGRQTQEKIEAQATGDTTLMDQDLMERAALQSRHNRFPSHASSYNRTNVPDQRFNAQEIGTVTLRFGRPRENQKGRRTGFDDELSEQERKERDAILSRQIKNTFEQGTGFGQSPPGQDDRGQPRNRWSFGRSNNDARFEDNAVRQNNNRSSYGMGNPGDRQFQPRTRDDPPRLNIHKVSLDDQDWRNGTPGRSRYQSERNPDWKGLPRRQSRNPLPETAAVDPNDGLSAAMLEYQARKAEVEQREASTKDGRYVSLHNVSRQPRSQPSWNFSRAGIDHDVAIQESPLYPHPENNQSSKTKQTVKDGLGNAIRDRVEGDALRVQVESEPEDFTSRFRSPRFAVNAEPPTKTYDTKPKHRGRAQTRQKDPEYEELEDYGRDFEDGVRKEKKKQKPPALGEPVPTSIQLPPFISVRNLATALNVRLEAFMQKLEELGFEEIAADHVLSAENAGLVAMEYNFEPIVDRSESEDLKALPVPDDQSLLPQRPPVVTIMGHVDHGKTTLLDYLRSSSVAASEHGGITQHIGAFSVRMASGKIITFLDTPGHAAFLTMRQRGANVTDIVILVVAADDSVKPQTIEAIKHATSAKVPLIVAINKIDKEEANPNKVKQDLTRHGIEVEDYGGDIQAVEVSGKTGQGMDTLEDAVVALAEILDKRAQTDGQVEGWVLEGTSKAAGRVATVLVRRGTLRTGNVVVAGTTWARVRTLKNEAGMAVREAGPGTPVEVDGWRDQPAAGDEVLQAPNEAKAKSVVQYRAELLERSKASVDMEAINASRKLDMERREREKQIEAAQASKNGQASPIEALNPVKPVVEDGKKVELYFVIKADVFGSVEAVQGSLTGLPLSNQPVSLTVLHTGVGPVSQFDVEHVGAAPPGHGFIISFNQPVSNQMIQQAEQAGVRILDENIIYKAIDKVRALVEEKLPPVITTRVTGELEIAQVFDISLGGRKTVKIAGCKVRTGTVARDGKVKVYRTALGDTRTVEYQGTITSLKSHKKDVFEMRKGTECGLGFADWEGFEVGDEVQCYEEVSEKRRLL